MAKNKWFRETYTEQTLANHEAFPLYLAAAQKHDLVDMELTRKWGGGKLIDLVSNALATKFNKQIEALIVVLEAEDYPRAVKLMEACTRGLAVLDAEATKLGHTPSTPVIWHTEHRGTRYAVVMTLNDEWQLEPEDGLHVTSLQGLLADSQALRDGIFLNPKPIVPPASQIDGGPVDPDCAIPF